MDEPFYLSEHYVDLREQGEIAGRLVRETHDAVGPRAKFIRMSWLRHGEHVIRVLVEVWDHEPANPLTFGGLPRWHMCELECNNVLGG